jgi:hypothetical protein
MAASAISRMQGRVWAFDQALAIRILCPWYSKRDKIETTFHSPTLPIKVPGFLLRGIVTLIGKERACDFGPGGDMSFSK